MEYFWQAYGQIIIPLKNIVIILFLLNVGLGLAQVENPDSLQIQDSKEKDSLKTLILDLSIDADTDFNSIFSEYTDSLSTDRIRLERVEIVAPFKFDSREERRQYLILKRKTEKVWPFAVVATERLNVLRERLDVLESKYDKRVYTRRVQNYMEEQFTKQLRDLTKTEGQILVKLMNRQTGETTFEVIRDLRTGWRAFRYNVTAGVFTISLKEEYNPLENKEDFYIEHIIRRGIQMGDLENQTPVIDIDYSEIMEKWEGI